MHTQQAAITVILDLVKRDEAVRAAFLKGSLARGEADRYSDVDFFCLVQSSQVEAFLLRRRTILELYRPILYWADKNFVGPQAAVVFDDGLHFDLFTVTLDKLPTQTPIKILHDPDNLLAAYTAIPLTIPLDEVVTRFDYAAFTIHEIHAAIQRGNTLWARYLTQRMAADIATIYRYLHTPDQAQLGIRHIDRVLDQPMRQRFMAASTAPIIDSTRQYALILQDIARQFPDNTPFNWRFFVFTLAQIERLFQENDDDQTS